MAKFFKMWTFQFANPQQEKQYDDYLQDQRLLFFRALLITLTFPCFFAMLVFIIQDQSAYLISLMVVFFIFHVVVLYFSQKFINCLKLILSILYIFYVSGGIILTYIGFDVPLYNFGMTSGILHSCVLQFCDNKFKIIYVFITNWFIVGFFVRFELAQLQYLVCSFSMFFLLGVATYLLEYTRRSQFLLSLQVNSQKKILYDFSNDPLLEIIYNNKQRSFQLLFANKKFEAQYKTDLNENNVKDFLRTHFVLNKSNLNSYRSLSNKHQNKQINLEEYLFDLIQSNIDDCNEDRFLIETTNGKEKQQIDILKFESNKIVFFISIRENQAKFQIEKYENIIKDLNENFKSILIMIGNKLEEQYKQLSYVSDNQEMDNVLMRKFQCNIQFLLNQIKNQMIYLQKGKMPFLKQQIEQFKIYKLNDALSNYFLYYCQLFRKQFLLECQYEVEQQLINLNARLLTQLLINCFNKILKISEDRGTIRFQIDLKRIPTQKLTESNQNQNQDLQLIQFSYTFEHKDRIENIEAQFYQQINTDSQQPIEIESVVNLIILQILGSQDFIYIKQIYQQHLSNHKTTLKFDIYSDQTQLDPSFTKYIKKKSQDY